MTTSTREALLASAQDALRHGNQRAALANLLELEDRFPTDRWVLESLARVHRRMRQPEQGLHYVRAALALGDSDDMRALEGALEGDLEAFYRDRARFEVGAGRAGRAFEAALVAASVANPSTWTIRILTDTAVATNRKTEAAELVGRARQARPDDARLADFESRLNG